MWTGRALDRKRTRRRFRKGMSLMSAASAFDTLEVPPLSGATRHFVIPVLFGIISDSNQMLLQISYHWLGPSLIVGFMHDGEVEVI